MLVHVAQKVFEALKNLTPKFRGARGSPDVLPKEDLLRSLWAYLSSDVKNEAGEKNRRETRERERERESLRS
jgi:hypothetical protein